MASVFQKHLKKELGKQRYDKYCMFFEDYKLDKSIQNRRQSSRDVYEDLYDYLKDQDVTILHKKMERLIDSMCEAVNISKYYIFAFLFYLAGSLFLIIQNLEPRVTIISLLLLSALFIFKTCEFVVNKYCFIDANIILVYKSVLDRLLQNIEKKEEQVK